MVNNCKTRAGSFGNVTDRLIHSGCHYSIQFTVTYSIHLVPILSVRLTEMWDTVYRCLPYQHGYEEKKPEFQVVGRVKTRSVVLVAQKSKNDVHNSLVFSLLRDVCLCAATY